MADETQGQGGTPEAQGETPAPVDFDTWLGSQDETVKGLLTQHTGGLRTALQQERDNAKQLAKQLKELGGKLEANSEAAKQVAELSAKLEEAQRYAEFYKEASTAGCRYPDLAWDAAKARDLTLKQVQQQYPDLFAPRPATNAGHGASNANGGAQRDMNAFIRKAAGR